METKNNVTIGSYVQFLYRNNSILQLTGCVVNILQNTIVVDIADIAGTHAIEENRQVVKYGYYKVKL
ncbi:DUF2187 domain-containing protein [Bacillus thuringiensis]|uniref:DUF2187 domain-containing protein n=1 Tax=Bacillus cereus group TaxID=86661 RepID=UPI000BEFAB2F|nr:MULTISPECIES: DUF2187 domain-containing protein [Bacillus cereus group]MDM8362582.1 DUF2187 domain-containing protein [Bacillus thuringiensis]PEL98794.1 DUF2187 domain-containing protein [Bacillus cereus]